MLVVVPDDGTFERFRSDLTVERLAEMDAELTPGAFELWLPRWETSTTIEPLTWLEQIGAAPGSYPGISPDAFLGAAIHGADIAVDEWGTVAAAATAFGFDESGGGEPDVKIKADRPFLYLIRHRPSGLVPFAGQVIDPNK